MAQPVHPVDADISVISPDVGNDSSLAVEREPIPIIVVQSNDADRMNGASANDNGDSDSSGDEAELETVSEPSDDIKADLVDALREGSKFEGSFYLANSFPQAPNPCMIIDDFGLLGLPLNALEAKRLATLCSHAPFGKKDQTIIDKSVRDTWELSPSKIKFTNTAWTKWIEKTVVPAVSKGLGVLSTKPVAKLYKLLLYETGSHFMAHQDTEKVPGMFGSIIITLPSPYSGASIHLSHAGQTKVLDYASTSGTTTWVFAWYSDVVHSVHPVESGYRLALAYNLLTPPSLSVVRPTLPQTAAAVARLRHVLLSWRQSEPDYDIPIKLVYNLDHAYSINNLGSGILKGKDAQLVSFLRPVAEECQFRVYLANVELYQRGSANDEGWNRGPNGHGWDSSSEDEERGHSGMAEVHENDITLTNVVDLDGNKVSMDGIRIEEEDEMIPFLLSEQEADEEEYEGYQGNGAGGLEFWYRRTAVVIYPKKNEPQVYTRDPVVYAMERLQQKIDRGWTARDLQSKHISTLLEGCGKLQDVPRIKKALAILCRCASLGYDHALWIRAVRACGAVGAIGRMGVRGFVDGIKVFGLEKLKPLFEDVLLDAVDNTSRYALAKRLVDECQKPELTLHQDWAIGQQRYVRGHLKPLSQADVSLLLEIAYSEGMVFFSETIVNQLEQLRPTTSILIDLARRLQQETSGWRIEDGIMFQNIMDRLILLVLDTTSAPCPSRFEANLIEFVNVVTLCEEVDALAQLPPVIDKFARSFRSLEPAKCPAACIQLLLPLYGRLELERSTSARLRAECVIFAPLYSLVDFVFQYGMTAKQFPDMLNNLIFAISHISGGMSTVRSLLTTHIPMLARHDLDVLKRFTIELYKARPTLSLESHNDYEALRDILHQLVGAIVSNTSLNMTGRKRSYGSYGDPFASTRDSTPIEMIEFCLSFGDDALALCELVTRQLYPPEQQKLASWFTDWFSRFIRRLNDLLDKTTFDLATEPFRTVVVSGIRAFVTVLVGPRPVERALERTLLLFGCGCDLCNRMKSFMLGEKETESFYGVQKDRTHMHKQLQHAESFALGFTAETERGHLKLTKPDYMVAPARWRVNAETAIKAISHMGDSQLQRRILGDECEVIYNLLQLQVPPTLANMDIGPSSTGDTSCGPSTTLGPFSNTATPSTTATAVPSGKRRMTLTETSQPPKKSKLDDGAEVIVLSD